MELLIYLNKNEFVKTFQKSVDIYHDIENIILTHSSRGMDFVKHAVPEGYCNRAAQLMLHNKGVVLIGTGFPVKSTFETDGPIGAISLYNVLEHLGYNPMFVCAPPLSKVLKKDFATYEIPILSWEESIPVMEAALKQLQPTLIVSIEQPGVAWDGRYYNMRKQDITNVVAKCDLFFRHCSCPTVAFGDGGNEIGMGNIGKGLSRLSIIPSVTTCDELVIATVSNWGVYGMLAVMSHTLQQDLFTLFDLETITMYLVKNGAIDGVTKRAECSEDGFPLAVGLSIIVQLRESLAVDDTTLK
jgi:hypothetical protein